MRTDISKINEQTPHQDLTEIKEQPIFKRIRWQT